MVWAMVLANHPNRNGPPQIRSQWGRRTASKDATDT